MPARVHAMAASGLSNSIGVGGRAPAENVSTLRRLALNPAKGEKSLKIGVAAKRKRTGWDLERLRAIIRLAQEERCDCPAVSGEGG